MKIQHNIKDIKLNEMPKFKEGFIERYSKLTDWEKFKNETGKFDDDEDTRVGKYVIWDSNTGEVWVREEGGGWGSNPEKGNLIFQSDSWKYNYSNGGGGW